MKATLTTVSILTVTTFIGSSVEAAFNSFVIRNDGSGNPPVIQTNNTYVSGATEFVIAASGQKAGWGSNDINGIKINQITSLSITRHDDTTRFTSGSGPAVAPYFNIWITNGTNYAVVSNEPSDSNFQSLFVSNGDGSKSYNLSYTNLSDKVAKIYETAGGGGTNTWVHQELGKVGQTLTFADVANYVIKAPTVSELNTGWTGLGTGAPRELGTNVAYGFNWVFGDTLSNYVSGSEGYVVSNPSVVPEPAILGLLGLGGLLLGRRRR